MLSAVGVSLQIKIPVKDVTLYVLHDKIVVIFLQLGGELLVV